MIHLLNCYQFVRLNISFLLWVGTSRIFWWEWNKKEPGAYYFLTCFERKRTQWQILKKLNEIIFPWHPNSLIHLPRTEGPPRSLVWRAPKTSVLTFQWTWASHYFIIAKRISPQLIVSRRKTTLRKKLWTLETLDSDSIIQNWIFQKFTKVSR